MGHLTGGAYPQKGRGHGSAHGPGIRVCILDGPLAQLVEQLTFNQWVTGSNPVRLTILSPR